MNNNKKEYKYHIPRLKVTDTGETIDVGRAKRESELTEEDVDGLKDMTWLSYMALPEKVQASFRKELGLSFEAYTYKNLKALIIMIDSGQDIEKIKAHPSFEKMRNLFNFE